MKIQIHSPSHYITDLRYPWSKHLTQWPPELFVEVARGIHRNVVRFISNKGRVYALKELMTPIARNEYNLLREMEEMGLPVVEPVGLVTNRDEGVSQARSSFNLVGDNMDMSNRALLVTHYLEGALPYRIIIQQGISQGVTKGIKQLVADPMGGTERIHTFVVPAQQALAGAAFEGGNMQFNGVALTDAIQAADALLQLIWMLRHIEHHQVAAELEVAPL